MLPRTKKSAVFLYCEESFRMSGILDADTRCTASAFLRLEHTLERFRILDICNPRAIGKQPNIPGMPLRWQTEAGIGADRLGMAHEACTLYYYLWSAETTG
jgi:hypothetical protein